MNPEVFAIVVLVLLAFSGLAVSLLIAGLNRQLQIQRDALKTAIQGLAEVHTAECQILHDLEGLHEILADHTRDLKRLRIAAGDLPPDEPKSLGLTPTPVKLTPPAHDPEEEKHRRRRHHSHKGTVK